MNEELIQCLIAGVQLHVMRGLLVGAIVDRTVRRSFGTYFPSGNTGNTTIEWHVSLAVSEPRMNPTRTGLGENAAHVVDRSQVDLRQCIVEAIDDALRRCTDRINGCTEGERAFPDQAGWRLLIEALTKQAEALRAFKGEVEKAEIRA